MNSSPSAHHSQPNRVVRWADQPVASPFSPTGLIHQITRVTIITVREMIDNRLSLRAGALTYAILLSMVPMLAMSTAVVKGLGGGNQLKEVVIQYIDTLESAVPTPSAVSPDSGPVETTDPAAQQFTDITTHLRSATEQIFDYVDRTNFATLGTIGILGIFLSVLLVLNQIESAMNDIWHVTDGRSILRKVSDYLTLMVLMPISINVALAAGTILESQSLAIHIDRFIPAAWIQALLLKGIPVFFLTLTLYIVYLFFPNTKLKQLPTLIGAFSAGCLWFITQNLYISLQVGVANYNAIYGSFATIPLFLIWIYLGWLFVLLGAQVSFAIQNVSSYQLIKKPLAPTFQLSAAFDMLDTIKRRFTQQRATSLNDVREKYPFYEPELLEATRDALIQARFIHQIGETDELMPSLPLEQLTNKRVIETVLGAEPPHSAGGRTSKEIVATAAACEPPIAQPGEEPPDDSDSQAAPGEPTDGLGVSVSKDTGEDQTRN